MQMRPLKEAAYCVVISQMSFLSTRTWVVDLTTNQAVNMLLSRDNRIAANVPEAHSISPTLSETHSPAA
jgi:hypothetical protein